MIRHVGLCLLLLAASASARTIYFSRTLSSLLTIGDVPDPRIPRWVATAATQPSSQTPYATLVELSEMIAGKRPAPGLVSVPTLAETVTEREVASPSMTEVARSLADSTVSAEQLLLDARFAATVSDKWTLGATPSLDEPDSGTIEERAHTFAKSLKYVAAGILNDDGKLYLDWALALAVKSSNELNDAVAAEVAASGRGAKKKKLSAYYSDEGHRRLRHWLKVASQRVAELKEEGNW